MSKRWVTRSTAAAVAVATAVALLVVVQRASVGTAAAVARTAAPEAAADHEHPTAKRHVAHVDVTAARPPEAVAQLQALLSHHATLTVRLTRATLTDDPDFVDAAESALVRNIDDVEAAVKPAIGAARARQLSAQWEGQSQALFQYAAGIRDDDPSAAREAQENLDRGGAAQADLLARLGDGRVDQSKVADALGGHIDRQIEQVAAFSDGRFERAYELQRAIFADAFPLGRTIADALMRVPAPTPADELQTALAKLLGEHVELAIDTMRAGATGADDFEAAAAALDANTREVTDAMDTLLGAKRARQFNDVWADHIDLFVDYTIAVVEGDAEAKAGVRDRFDKVMRRFGTTLQAATDGAVEAALVTKAMGQHEQQLVGQIEEYAEADYATAHELSYHAYTHIRDVAGVLGAAFTKALSHDLPRGGSQTGGGGTAGR